MGFSAAGSHIASHRHRDIIYLLTINVSSLFLHPIVLAYAMDPLTVTFWRCFLGALIFLPIAIITQPKFYKKITGSQLLYMLLAGAALAIHFIALMVGLYQVSLGIALTIMSTSTIWVGLLGMLLLKQMLSAGQWAGLFTGVAGIVLFAVVGDSLDAKDNSALLWLLLSAVTGAFYFITGQKIRSNVNNVTYVGIVYSAAAAIALGYALISGNSILIKQPSDWVGILLITFFGQIMVHTVSNLYLKHGEAAVLKLSLLIQIPIISVIGWILFDQRLGIEVLPALLLTIFGLVIFNLTQPKH